MSVKGFRRPRQSGTRARVGAVLTQEDLVETSRQFGVRGLVTQSRPPATLTAMTTSSQARVDRACAFADRLDRMAAWLERHRLRRRAITVRWVAAMLRGRIAQVALNTIPPGGELHFPAGIYAMRGTLKLPHIPADGPKSVVTFGPGSVMIPVEGEASQTASWVRDQP